MPGLVALLAYYYKPSVRSIPVMARNASVHCMLLLLLVSLSIFYTQNVTPLATVPDVGPAACAWKHADGARCDETLEKCAPGCPCYYPQPDGTCGSAQEAAAEAVQRDFLYTESEKVYLDIYDCLKGLGAFNETRAKAIQDRANDVLARGSTMQNDLQGSCSIQDAGSVAGQTWERIKEQRQNCYAGCDNDDPACSDACDADVDPRVTEAKAANVYAYYDWAVESDRQRAFAGGSDTTTEPAAPSDDSLTARFQSLEKKSKPIMLDTAWDIEGKTIDPNVLKGGLGPSLPSAGVGVGWGDISADEVASIAFPEGLPIRKAVLITGERVAKGTNSYVTVIDGSTPRLLGTGIPEPEPRRYELKDYIKFDTTLAKEEKHPFKEALFEIAVSNVVSQEFYDSVKVLRWNQQRAAWDYVPAQKTSGCTSGAACTIVAQSPGTSVFALVVERNATNETMVQTSEGSFSALTLGLIGFGAILFVLLLLLGGIGLLVYLGYRVGKAKK